LSLTTSFFTKLSSPSLNIYNLTIVQAGHFILLTASTKFIHCKLISFAEIIISPDLKSNFLAGDHLIILSIATQSGLISTTAQIPSKSQDSVSLKLLFSSLLK